MGLNFGLIVYNFRCNRVNRFNPFEPHIINRGVLSLFNSKFKTDTYDDFQQALSDCPFMC
ncbi:hypothetical protein BpHYR1_012710 [Brachionus plicatilis]|uniref:Uncharacterized protein n=1 Tax=Brachionus plicatilis TaxID=10195 RepID=A0A3M7S1G8_BRAPC|nr:hypothetical protein BpHYR1_012710 [Brachionus plicatilis]